MTILKPFAIVTKKLQSPTVTLSDFYGLWLNLKLKMERLRTNNDFASQLFSGMEKWNARLVESPIMFAALCLDPRYNIVLDEAQRNIAIDLLVSIYRRYESRNAVQSSQETQNENDLSLDEVSIFINRIRNGNNVNPPVQNINDIGAIICNFKDEELLSKSVLVYWQEQKLQKPELYKLANIVFAISPTQSSVERAFSALALILTPLRSKIGDILLNEILLIRLNKTIYFE